MVKQIIATVALGVLAFSGTLAAQAKPEIVMRVPPATNGDDPVAMFREYCAACQDHRVKAAGRPQRR